MGAVFERSPRPVRATKEELKQTPTSMKGGEHTTGFHTLEQARVYALSMEGSAEVRKSYLGHFVAAGSDGWGPYFHAFASARVALLSALANVADYQSRPVWGLTCLRRADGTVAYSATNYANRSHAPVDWHKALEFINLPSQSPALHW